MKTWQKNDIYNFSEEFNRIEGYNKYCQEWLALIGINVDITNKTNWNVSDIIDITDLNRIKNNINVLLDSISSDESKLIINTQANQNWTYAKANEMEKCLNEVVKFVVDWQFRYETIGLAITGNFLRLGGVD